MQFFFIFSSLFSPLFEDLQSALVCLLFIFVKLNDEILKGNPEDYLEDLLFYFILVI